MDYGGLCIGIPREADSRRQGRKVQTCQLRRRGLAQGHYYNESVMCCAGRVSPLTCLAVERFIEKNRLPHLLFYGPPGTGKTSTILAVARRIYGADYKKQILEVSTLTFLVGSEI